MSTDTSVPQQARSATRKRAQRARRFSVGKPLRSQVLRAAHARAQKKLSSTHTTLVPLAPQPTLAADTSPPASQRARRREARLLQVLRDCLAKAVHAPRPPQPTIGDASLATLQARQQQCMRELEQRQARQLCAFDETCEPGTQGSVREYGRAHMHAIHAQQRANMLHAHAREQDVFVEENLV